MDFYLSTPTGDIHLFSTEDGRIVEAAPPPDADPAPPAPEQ